MKKIKLLVCTILVVAAYIVLSKFPTVTQTFPVTNPENPFHDFSSMTMVKHYEMSDGTWRTDNHTYQYRLEFDQDAKTYVVLTNKEDLTLEEAIDYYRTKSIWAKESNGSPMEFVGITYGQS